MTDYQPLLARALKGLDRNTSEARRSIYDRARQALLNQLRSANPPLADADITRERLALEDAIRKTETEAVLAEPHSVRATPSVRMPLASRTAAPLPPRSPIRSPTPPKPAVPPAVEPQAQKSLATERPVSPAPASSQSPALTLPPSLLPTSQPAVRAAPIPSQRSGAGSPPARPPLPPRSRPMPANGARPERAAHPEQARPRGGSPRRDPLHDPLDEFSQEFEPRQAPVPPAQRRPERPRRPVHDEALRGEVLAEDLSPPPPPARPRMPRPSSPPPPGVSSPKVRPQKSNHTKILMAGLAVLLIAGVGVLAYTFRGRLTQTAAPQAPVAGTDQPKSSERIAQSPDEGRRSTPTNLDPAVAQRAVLYEENPGGGQQFQNFVGTAVWKTEAVTGSGRAPELGLRIEVEIPDRHISVLVKMRKNNDPSFPASHTIEVQFTVPPGDAFGGVSDMRGIRAKAGETAQGNPIAAEVQKVKEGYFLLALPKIEEDNNLAMLRERDWLDIPFVYANGRRAVLTLQKGTPGERAVREVFMSWGKGGGG